MIPPDMQMQNIGIIGIIVVTSIIAGASIASRSAEGGTLADPTAAPQDETYTVEYYYKVRWGHADEFIRLFRKNHYPILERQVEAGRFVSVSGVQPRYHMTEDSRWDYRVTIVFRDVAAAHEPDNEDEIILKLYPDQETFRREEQRRFEILKAHWDLPIITVNLEE